MFPGGATADAVARACLPAGSSLDEAEDALAALCDKSLVQLLATPDGGVPRYRMLETLREFGSERLAARGELLATRRAHARHYRSVAEGCEPLLREARQIDAVRMFDAEHDNLLAALRFAADDGDSDTAIRLAASLGWYWVLMDSHAEAATWMSVALDTPGSSDPGARALVTGLYAVNSVASGLTDLSDEGTMAGLLDGVPDVEPLGGHPLLAVVRPARALLSQDVDAFESESLRSLEHPDPWARAVVHLLKVQVYENFGDVPGMHRHVGRGLELFRSVGDRWGAAMSLTSLGELLLLEQDEQGALAAHEEALRLTTELLPRSRDNADALMHLAQVHLRLGDRERAGELLERARASAEASGSRHHLAMADLTLANLARRDGDLASARSALDSAESRLGGSTLLVPQLEAMVHVARVHLDLVEGRPEDVPRLLATSYRLARASRDAPIAARVAVAAAHWSAFQGDAAGAAELVGVGDALRGAPDAGEPDVAALSAGCAAVLGDDGFRAAVRRGAGLGHGQALARLADVLAIADEEHPFRPVAPRA